MPDSPEEKSIVVIQHKITPQRQRQSNFFLDCFQHRQDHVIANPAIALTELPSEERSTEENVSEDDCVPYTVIDTDDTPEESPALTKAVGPRHNRNIAHWLNCCNPMSRSIEEVQTVPSATNPVISLAENMPDSPEEKSIVVIQQQGSISSDHDEIDSRKKVNCLLNCCPTQRVSEVEMTPSVTNPAVHIQEAPSSPDIVQQVQPNLPKAASKEQIHVSFMSCFDSCRSQQTTPSAITPLAEPPNVLDGEETTVTSTDQQAIAIVPEDTPDGPAGGNSASCFACCSCFLEQASSSAANIPTGTAETQMDSKMTATTFEEEEDEQRPRFDCFRPKQVSGLRKEIVADLYREVKEEALNQEDREECTCCQCCNQCIDACCQAQCELSSCKLPSFRLFGRRTQAVPQPRVPKKNKMTKVLLKAKEKGIGMLQHMSLSFLEKFVKHILLLWVLPEFLLGLIGFFLSAATLSLDQNRAFNIIHFVLITLATVLATVDFIETLYKSVKKSPCCSERHICNNVKCPTNKCSSFCSKATDWIRVISTELILYPLLICDIFEVTTGRAFEPESHGDRLGIFLFVVSCVYFVLYVYVARIIILVGMIRNVVAVRKPEKALEQEGALTHDNYDPQIRKSAIWYQVSFVIHMILQMLVQVMMFIAIGGKIRYDNRHFYETGNSDESIHVSGYLWYMMVAGFFVPFMGFFSFFVVTFHWTNEFPIGVYFDMISLMKMGSCGAEELVNPIESIKDKEGTARNMISRKISELKEDFNNLRNTKLVDKLSVPFTSPVLVVVCMVYFGLQLAFVLCAALAVDQSTGGIGIQILNGGGWVVYYFLALVVGIIANIYTFLVVGSWIVIIAVILGIIAMILALIVLVIGGLILLSCLSGSSSNNNTRRYP